MATVTIDFNDLPIQRSFTLKQGDTLLDPIHLTIKAEAATTYSNLTLVGCTLKLYVKKGSTTAIDGTALTPDVASEGKFTLLIAAATTATWSGEYTYEVEITFPTSHTNFPSGAVKTVLNGNIRISTDI